MAGPAYAWGLHVGDLNVDVLLQLPAWPRPGEEVWLRHWHWSPGGSATNAALLLARWGWPTQLLARLGNDLWGQALVARLQAFPHLNLDLLQRDDRLPTGVVFVLVDETGERTFLTQRGANQELEMRSQVLDAVAQGVYLHITGFNALAPRPRETTQALMERARSQGMPVVLDVGTYPAQHAREVLLGWLPQTTVLSLTLTEARLLLNVPGASPDELVARLAQRVPVVALRMGQQGALLAWAGGVQAYPPLPLETVDTTGAGDAFTAGLLLGTRLGLPWEARGWLAHLLGALATTVLGAGPHLPGPEAWERHWPQLQAYLPREVARALTPERIGLPTAPGAQH